MPKLSRAHEDHVRELLNGATVARDQLPYSEAFAVLKAAFYDRTFMKLTDAEFWQACVTVAKKGGIRGKAKAETDPILIESEKDLLSKSVPSGLGSRDRLPYTDVFKRLVARFNAASGRSFTEREVWLAILNLAK